MCLGLRLFEIPEPRIPALGCRSCPFSTLPRTGAFAAGCEQLKIRITRTKPRHAWTNGVVERFQKTILHEHWRIAFRRQYFTGRRALQATLDRFLQFYNCDRPHRGYRLNGRTPATAFAGAVAA